MREIAGAEEQWLGMNRTGRKREICRGAARVFAQKGFESTSVDEIAAHLGVAKGTIYYHFGGKRELFAAMISDGLERLLVDAERSIEKVDDPVEQLSRVLDVLLEHGRRHIDFMRLFFREVLASGREWLTEVAEYRDRFAKLVGPIITRGKAEGRILNIDTDTVIRYVLSALATAVLDLGDGSLPPAGSARLIKRMVMSGISCDPATAGIYDRG
jgi:AcrR family transcriptional regulator